MAGCVHVVRIVLAVPLLSPVLTTIKRIKNPVHDQENILNIFGFLKKRIELFL